MYPGVLDQPLKYNFIDETRCFRSISMNDLPWRRRHRLRVAGAAIASQVVGGMHAIDLVSLQASSARGRIVAHFRYAKIARRASLSQGRALVSSGKSQG